MFGKLRLPVALAVAIAALAASGSFAPLHAQDETYVNLSIEVVVGYQGGHGWTFIAENHGTAAAYSVTVDIEIADQVLVEEGDHDVGHGGFEPKSGTDCSGKIPGATCVSGVWTVGTLEPGGQKTLGLDPELPPGLTVRGDRWAVPARAVIKSAAPAEEARFTGDNAAVGWILLAPGTHAGQSARMGYWLEVSVDDLLPDAGDTVKFTVKAEKNYRSLYNAKVRLKLDNGMGTPTATAPDGTTFAAAAGLTRTWDWDFDMEYDTSRTLEVSTTLDSPLPAGVARSDLCLTAELTARPDNVEPDAGTSTSAEICLREDPVVLFQGGELPSSVFTRAWASRTTRAQALTLSKCW